MNKQTAERFVSKLHKLAHDEAATPAERAEAMRKMTELMSKYEVELIEESSYEEVAEVVEKEFVYNQRISYRRQRVRLMHAVLRYFDCMSVELVGKIGAVVTGYGTLRDMEAANMLADGLWEQLERDKEDAFLEGRSENYSFVTGWVNGLISQVNVLVRDRMREQAKAKRQLQLEGKIGEDNSIIANDAGTQATALAIFKQQTAEELKAKCNPHLHANQYRASVSDKWAYRAGFEDGQKANVGHRLEE